MVTFTAVVVGPIAGAVVLGAVVGTVFTIEVVVTFTAVVVGPTAGAVVLGAVVGGNFLFGSLGNVVVRDTAEFF